jgi:hypothetical protein
MTDIKFLFHTNVTELVDAINKLPPEAWYEFTLRQELFEPHKDTLTIPLKWNVISNYRYYDQSKLFDEEYNYSKFPIELIDAVSKISKELNDYWANYDISSIMLLKLLAGKKILIHRDVGMLEWVKRCHLAVITHPDCLFTVGETTMHMGVGDWYLINNILPHAVDNNSSIDRVHLLIDFGNTQ